MLTQRWRNRRDRYRPANEVIDPRAYEVAEISDDVTAKRFVTRHHYSGSFPAARFRFGLYQSSALVGVAVFSVPCNNKVLTNLFPCDPQEAVELGRFVLLDDVPGNGETWFLARAFEGLRRKGLMGVVSFSDPMPRTTEDGYVVFPGHYGTIYQAFNGVYLGRSTQRSVRLLPNGSVLHPRAISKIRSHEKGWDYSARLLSQFGAPPLNASDDAAAWLGTWLPKLTRSQQHPGNHRYAWGLCRSITRLLSRGLPYPKKSSA